MPNWIDLPGVVNMRDVGGFSTSSGRPIRLGRLLRSDNLQDLPPTSVERITGELGITDVVDLRTAIEVARTGDGPLAEVESVTIHHHDLHAAPPADADLATRPLPWQDTDFPDDDEHSERLAGLYESYLVERPDSIVASLRVIAQASGATIVHCAAGKDRTGTIVGLALTAVGVSRQDVVADYAASNERLGPIAERLDAVSMYSSDEGRNQATPSETLSAVLDSLDARYGGVQGWLSEHGWTTADQAQLVASLLGA